METLFTKGIFTDYKVFRVQRKIHRPLTRSRYGSDIKVTESAQDRPSKTQEARQSGFMDLKFQISSLPMKSIRLYRIHNLFNFQISKKNTLENEFFIFYWGKWRLKWILSVKYIKSHGYSQSYAFMKPIRAG